MKRTGTAIRKTGRTSLSLRTIVATAIAIADSNGLNAVTLRGVATRLGVHVTSLYNHVPTKDAVIEEIVKSLLAEARLPTGPLAWPEWVQKFADAMRALARKHPGAFEAFHYSPARGARAHETFEAALAAFRADGFDVVSALNALRATIVAVLGLTLDEVARRHHPGMRTNLDELPIERFPRIHEADGVAAEADTFGYVIRSLIEGFRRNRHAPTG